MSSHEVFMKYYRQLIQSLPMNDVLFIAFLFSEGLLPGDLKDQIEAKSTRIEKNDCFLRHVIIPYLEIDDHSVFMKLLNIMENSEYFSVKELADQIKSELKEKSSDTAG